MALIPDPPVAGQPFQVTYSFHNPKDGGVIGIFPAGTPSCFGVTGQCDWLYNPPLGHAPIVGASGSATLTAPTTPGTYVLQFAYRPDGGTLWSGPFTVVAPPATTAPAAPAAPPAAQAAPAVAQAAQAAAQAAQAAAQAAAATAPVPAAAAAAAAQQAQAAAQQAIANPTPATVQAAAQAAQNAAQAAQAAAAAAPAAAPAAQQAAQAAQSAQAAAGGGGFFSGLGISPTAALVIGGIVVLILVAGRR
jgi:hypothetical protein